MPTKTEAPAEAETIETIVGRFQQNYDLVTAVFGPYPDTEYVGPAVDEMRRRFPGADDDMLIRICAYKADAVSEYFNSTGDIDALTAAMASTFMALALAGKLDA
jgi:hypothetical protein